MSVRVAASSTWGRRAAAGIIALVLGLGLVAPAHADRTTASQDPGTLTVMIVGDLGAPLDQLVVQALDNDGGGYALTRSSAGVLVSPAMAPGRYDVVLWDLGPGQLYGYGRTVLNDVAVVAGRRTSQRVTLGAPMRERRSARAVDTGNREAVQSLYRSISPLLTKQAQSSADPDTCALGQTAGRSQTDTLKVVNAARSLVGLDPAALSAAYNTQAQRAAVLMAANNTLSHQPPRGWKCWTSTGASAAASSNLALGASGPSAVAAYLADPGAGNLAVGHRRTLLDPGNTVIGAGNSGGSGKGQQTNAIFVGGAQDDDAATPRFTSWPAAGWFPRQWEPSGRWSVSVSRPDVTFERATVSVRMLSGSVPNRAVRVVRYAPQVGYGLNTLSFGVSGLVGAGDGVSASYQVTVSGLRHRGVPVPGSFTYVVRLFDADS